MKITDTVANLLKKKNRQPSVTTDNLKTIRAEIVSRPQVRTFKKSIVVSLLIAIASLLLFLMAILISIYHFQSRNFIVKTISGWIPFPIASIDGNWATYRQYLDESDRLIHYFENQQNIDLKQPNQSTNLLDIKQRSFQYVVDQVYIEQLAKQLGLSVSSAEIEAELELFRQQHELVDQDQINQVLSDFFGLTYDQYLDRVEAKLLKQKLIEAADKGQTLNKAQTIMAEIKSGGDFSQLAKQYSDDPVSGANGGKYGFWLDLYQYDEDPRVLAAIFETGVGQVSDIIQLGDRIEIIKVLDENRNQRQAAHIRLDLITKEEVLTPIKSNHPVRVFIQIK